LNSQVLAISCDPVFSNRAWGKSLGGISYPLLSDFWPHGEVCKKYGVFDEKAGRPQRAIFVADRDGKLRWLKKYEAGVLPDNAELLEELKKL